MNTLDRYISCEWFKVFVVVLGSLIGLLILQDAADHVGDFRRGGTTFADLAAYYLWLIPGFLPWLLPVALFVSSLFVMAMLRRNNEIPVLRACGVSMAYLVRSLLFVSFCLSGLTFAMNVSLSSRAIEKAQRILSDVTGNSINRHTISNFEMNVATEGRRWFFRRFSAIDYKGKDVHLYSRTDQGSDSYRIQAGEVFRQADGSWVFLKGRFLGFASSRGVPVPAAGGLIWKTELGSNLSNEKSLSTVPVVNKPFERLLLADVRDEPKPFLLMHKKPSQLSLRELEEVLAHSPDPGGVVARPYALRRAHAIWASPGCLLAVALGIPFALVGNGRSATASVARALGLILCYYVAKTSGEALGEAGVLSIKWAAGLPMLMLGFVAMWLFWRIR